MKKIFLFLFGVFVILNGCSTVNQGKCKPVLFPYGEYHYKAVPREIGPYVYTNGKSLEFHGLKIVPPDGWQDEKVLSGSDVKAIRFCKEGNRFLLIFSKNKVIPADDYTNFKMIGCDDFNTQPDQNKSRQDFYTDLYLFTDADITDPPTFWQYYVLWAKTTFLRDTEKLFHFKGKNVQAFQRNLVGKAHNEGDVAIKIEIFPKKTAPDYFEIVTDMKGDAFFLDFLGMLDAMNSVQGPSPQ